MPYKLENRNQLTFLPDTVEQYITKDDPVRAYDVIVDNLFKEMDMNFNYVKAGAWEYHPVIMTKLIVYGYSYGIRSSRKLERAVHHNLSFIWLTCGLKPDYRTIARFRAENTELLKKILKASVRVCMKIDLIEGNNIFVDGSHIRANASISNTWDKERCEKYLEKTYKHIDQLLEESEKIDREEGDKESLVKLREEINNKEKMVAKVKGILEALKEENKQHINATDEDCVRSTNRQGKHSTYSAQITVDEKHGLIVSSEAVSQNNEYNQFSRQMLNAAENLEKMPEIGCGDSGYASTGDLAKLEDKMTIVIPNKNQITREKKGYVKGKYTIENFIYNADKDEFMCPAGKTLKFWGVRSGNPRKRIYLAYKKDCNKTCIHRKNCTIAEGPRQLMCLADEDVKQRLAAVYESKAGQEIYKKRKTLNELVFGHFKRNLGAGQFLLRGRKKVNAELSILSTCFNIVRMITLAGINEIIFTLKSTFA